MSAVCPPNDAEAQAECAYLQRVVNALVATLPELNAVQAGNWSDPAVWDQGRVPGPGDAVTISGWLVTLDTLDLDARLLQIKNGGQLSVANVPTSLHVGTLVTFDDDGSGPGFLTAGTQDIPLTAPCQITFTDNGPAGGKLDPKKLLGGWIGHGIHSVYGAAKTPYLALTTPAQAGQKIINLSAVPSGWNGGDELYLPGTLRGQSERAALASLRGSIATLAAPLRFTHAAPAGQQAYVANLTRNITFDVENPGPANGAHIMMMHSDMHTFAYARFKNTGRSDGSQVITDPKLDANGNIIVGTDANPRGRYGLHFHVTGANEPGTQNLGDPCIPVTGCVCEGAPRWGMVNHKSHVGFESNVSIEAFGSCMVREAGREIGYERNNLLAGATSLLGSTQPDTVGPRSSAADFGVTGNGLWAQSPGCTCTGNIAADCHFGFTFFTQGLMMPGTPEVLFPVANAPDPTLFPGQTWVKAQQVPLPADGFSHNTAYGCSTGLVLWFHIPPAEGLDVLDHFTAWNCYRGIFFAQNNSNQTVDSAWLRGTPPGNAFNAGSPVPSVGILSNLAYGGFQALQNSDIGGFGQALGFQGHLLTQVKSMAIDCPIGSQITPAAWDLNSGRSVNFSGQMTFGSTCKIPYQMLGPGYQNPDSNGDFITQQYLLPDGRQLYFADQVPRAVPFPAGTTPAANIPPELIGLTNQQIFDQYGLCRYGCLAPADAVPDPLTNGLVGSMTPMTAYYRIWPSGSVIYQLHVNVPTKVQYRKEPAGDDPRTYSYFTYPTPFTITRTGLQLITGTIDGRKWSWIVNGIA